MKAVHAQRLPALLLGLTVAALTACASAQEAPQAGPPAQATQTAPAVDPSAPSGPVIEVPLPDQPVGTRFASSEDHAQERAKQQQNEARMKDEVEPKGVKWLRGVLSPLAHDPRLGIPTYQRFGRSVEGAQP